MATGTQSSLGFLITVQSELTFSVTRSLVVLYVALIVIVEGLVRLLGFHRTWRLLAWLRPSKKRLHCEHEIVRAHLAAIKRARTRGPNVGKCLARSLVLWWQLGRYDISSTLVIGVNTTIDFRAHAWVEHRGRPLNAGKMVNELYASIARFDGPGAMK